MPAQAAEKRDRAAPEERDGFSSSHSPVSYTHLEAFPAAQEWLARYGYDAARIKAEVSRLALSLGGLIAKNTVAFGGGAAHFLTNLALVL